MTFDDGTDGVLLYRQLATELRYRIAMGNLEPGDRLPSLREGERRWGVSLHTVRRAYRALEDEGLVETRDRSGTRVSPHPPQVEASRDGDRFASTVLRLARERFGWDVDRLLTRIEQQARETAPVDDRVWVAECSDWLSARLARQISARWDVDARPWRLDDVGSAPPGLLVSTFYHHLDVTRRAGPRTTEPVFLTVELDPTYLNEVEQALSSRARRLLLCGVEPGTTRAMARDLRTAINLESGHGIDIAMAVTRVPSTLVDRASADTLVVCSPENWDALDDARRKLPHVLPHASRFRPEALEKLGANRGWPAVGNS